MHRNTAVHKLFRHGKSSRKGAVCTQQFFFLGPFYTQERDTTGQIISSKTAEETR
jgi:hypothetical protein